MAADGGRGGRMGSQPKWLRHYLFIYALDLHETYEQLKTLPEHLTTQMRKAPDNKSAWATGQVTVLRHNRFQVCQISLERTACV